MHDLHIGDFYQDAAKILVSLYLRFPEKSPLYIEDIAGPDTPDEFGLHSRRHRACLSAALWLSEEGFFRFNQTIQQIALDEVVLSQNSFLFFTSMDLDSKNTRINQIKRLLDENSSDKLNNYLHKLFCEFNLFKC